MISFEELKKLLINIMKEHHIKRIIINKSFYSETVDEELEMEHTPDDKIIIRLLKKEEL